MSKKLSPDTPIEGLNNVCLIDFWQWAYSDVLSNRNRSIFAEFLVCMALGIVDKPRVEWDAVDLRYGKHTVEVKAAGYVQSWHQTQKLSKITFDIGKKLGWDAATNTYPTTPNRISDCYVFCVHIDNNHTAANPLNTANWEFYVIPTSELEVHFGNQKTLALSRLKNVVSSVQYHQLKTAVDVYLSANNLKR